MNQIKKENIRQGLLYYTLATVTLAAIFFSYIFNGRSTEMMDFVGWIYFIASCVTHAAVFCLVPFLALELPLALTGCRRRIAGTVLPAVYALLFIVAVVNSYVYSIISISTDSSWKCLQGPVHQKSSYSVHGNT